MKKIIIILKIWCITEQIIDNCSDKSVQQKFSLLDHFGGSFHSQPFD